MSEENQEQQTEVQTVAKEEYDKVVAELEEVKTKLPKELTDEEKALQAKQQELWQKEVNLSLKENGLYKFASIVKVSNEDELKEVIRTLNTVINDLKVEMGYKPSDHKQNDIYSQFEKNKDTKGMIATKLSKLFN